MIGGSVVGEGVVVVVDGVGIEVLVVVDGGMAVVVGATVASACVSSE